MSPRALTEQEKEFQKKKILTKARELVLIYGVKHVSIDEIINAAGVGKATFYGYFSSKEELMIQLVWGIYQEILVQAEIVIKSSSRDKLPQTIGEFLKSLIQEKDKVFFFSNHQDLEQLISNMQPLEIQDFNQMEYYAFERLITLAGLDVRRVKPDVVHNYIHAMYFSISDSCMMQEHMEETITVMTTGLLNYLFGEVQYGGE